MNAQSATAYIVAQTKENILFLQSTNQISSEDAQLILSKLPSESSPPPKNPALRPPPPIPSSFMFRARALWSYNEDGRESNDHKFASGDTIEVIDTSNSDWWRGRLHGREGLFPSTYVERLPDPPSVPYPEKPPSFPTGPTYNTPYYPQQNPYPQQPPYHGPPQGPPPNGPYPPGPQQPPHQVVVVNQEDPKKKKGFFQGSLGNTLAHSAVGGAGFGAGSAVAGGIVNSIF
ncbi:hypothetical protein M413DRAFT_446019 [Hebeloma cylindrosporum]|uniref:SH3 domain-containing protein n=1 Tax=Hebeloma cylindrosporum TaxID=76867 RepID=A0A0C2XSB5_HEBCY|nr:hypothetical protein M413DRAFT_446019 [Hebeloma cylindrosporum h7]